MYRVELNWIEWMTVGLPFVSLFSLVGTIQNNPMERFGVEVSKKWSNSKYKMSLFIFLNSLLFKNRFVLNGNYINPKKKNRRRKKCHRWDGILCVCWMLMCGFLSRDYFGITLFVCVLLSYDFHLSLILSLFFSYVSLSFAMISIWFVLFCLLKIFNSCMSMRVFTLLISLFQFEILNVVFVDSYSGLCTVHFHKISMKILDNKCRKKILRCFGGFVLVVFNITRIQLVGSFLLLPIIIN